MPIPFGWLLPSRSHVRLIPASSIWLSTTFRFACSPGCLLDPSRGTGRSRTAARLGWTRKGVPLVPVGTTQLSSAGEARTHDPAEIRRVLKLDTKATAADLIEYVRPVLAGFKVPMSVEFLDGPLPLSGAFKPLKSEVRRRYSENRDRQVI